MPIQWLFAAGLLLALDQVSKMLALARLGRGPRAPVGLRPRIRTIGNPNLAMGLIRDWRALVFLWGVTVLGTILLLDHAGSLQGGATQSGLGIALGGATSNLLDRLRRGAVVDFIDLRVWPVFNLADAAIVCGVVIALFSAG